MIPTKSATAPILASFVVFIESGAGAHRPWPRLKHLANLVGFEGALGGQNTLSMALSMELSTLTCRIELEIMDDGTIRTERKNWGASDWQNEFMQQDLFLRPSTPVRVNWELVARIKKEKKLANEYLSARSRELQSQRLAPQGFAKKSLQRARRGELIQFGSVYCLALILEQPVTEVAVLDRDDPSQEGNQAPMYYAHDIVADIGIWLRLIAGGVLCVAGLYAIALKFGYFVAMRPILPIVAIGTSGAVAMACRRLGKFPMPLNLQLTSGLFFGVLSGALCYLAIAKVAARHLCDFSDLSNVQVALGLYLAGCVVAFSAGQALAAQPRGRLAHVLSAGSLLVAVFASVLASMNPPSLC